MNFGEIILNTFRLSACRFCHSWRKQSSLLADACPACVQANREWLEELEVRLAVPQGFQWPSSL